MKELCGVARGDPMYSVGHMGVVQGVIRPIHNAVQHDPRLERLHDAFRSRDRDAFFPEEPHDVFPPFQRVITMNLFYYKQIIMFYQCYLLLFTHTILFFMTYNLCHILTLLSGSGAPRREYDVFHSLRHGAGHVMADSIRRPGNSAWIPTSVGMTGLGTWSGSTAQFAILFENGYILLARLDIAALLT